MHNVGTNIRKATVEYSDEEYQLVMSTNLESTYKLSQVLLVADLHGGTPDVNQSGMYHYYSGTSYFSSEAVSDQSSV